VTIVSVGGGLGYGTLGYTHHGIEDIAALRPLPNISVYSPADPIETSEVLNKIHQDGKPAYLRLGKNGEPRIDEITHKKLPGQIRELKNGKDLTVISCGAIVSNCLMVANEIEPELSVQVISVPQVHSLNAKYLDSIMSSENLLVVEEHVERGGLASSILDSFNKLGINKKFEHRFVQESQITSTGSQEYLRGLSGLDKSSLKSTYLQIIRS
jgi:transketolase